MASEASSETRLASLKKALDRRRDDLRVYPTALGQNAIWSLDRATGGTPKLNMPMAHRLLGPVDTCAVRAGVAAVVARPDALRTRFADLGGRVVQIVGREADFEFEEVDLGSLSPAAREQAGQTIATEEARHRFDLMTGPLVRVKLVRMSASERWLFRTVHRSVADGWSLRLFALEFGAQYTALIATGSPLALDPPLQFGPLASSYDLKRRTGALDAQAAYWSRRLAGAAVPLSGYVPSSTSTAGDDRGKHCVLELPPALISVLRERALVGGASVFASTLTCFFVLLAKLTGKDDLLVATPVSNRDRAELRTVMGFIANILMIRCDLGDDPTLDELRRRVQEAILEGYANQDVSCLDVLEQMHREAFGAYVTSALFGLQILPLPRSELAGTTITALHVRDAIAKFDFSLNIWENSGSYTLDLEYKCDMFTDEQVESFGQFYLHAVEAIIRSPAARLSSLELMKSADAGST